MLRPPMCFLFFFFNDTATTEIYTLSLHDALPISPTQTQALTRFRALNFVEDLQRHGNTLAAALRQASSHPLRALKIQLRPEEQTSELQSPCNLVCRLLLEKKKKNSTTIVHCKIHE